MPRLPKRPPIIPSFPLALRHPYYLNHKPNGPEHMKSPFSAVTLEKVVCQIYLYQNTRFHMQALCITPLLRTSVSEPYANCLSSLMPPPLRRTAKIDQGDQEVKSLVNDVSSPTFSKDFVDWIISSVLCSVYIGFTSPLNLSLSSSHERGFSGSPLGWSI